MSTLHEQQMTPGTVIANTSDRDLPSLARCIASATSESKKYYDDIISYTEDKTQLYRLAGALIIRMSVMFRRIIEARWEHLPESYSWDSVDWVLSTFNEQAAAQFSHVMKVVLSNGRPRPLTMNVVCELLDQVDTISKPTLKQLSALALAWWILCPSNKERIVQMIPRLPMPTVRRLHSMCGMFPRVQDARELLDLCRTVGASQHGSGREKTNESQSTGNLRFSLH